jgi:hypothetical protein
LFAVVGGLVIVSIAGTVRYVINVVGPFTKWSVSKRYSQFEELQAAVLAEMNGKGCYNSIHQPLPFLTLSATDIINNIEWLDDGGLM